MKKFKTKSKNTKANKEAKSSKKSRKPKRHIFLIIIMSFLIFVSLAVLAFALFIIISAPSFDPNKLYKSSSSIILDSEGNTLTELGVQRRDNVSYDDLPDVLVDAIVATEDSKYFQHNGIDLMRFSKAVVGQLAGQSGAGGASTLTMQVVKNTYNGTVATGMKGIIRKFTDIYMAVFKVEKSYTKQEILEFYVNQPFLGSQSYGVEQASETYFGKHVSELNLSEASTIAGLFQAPSAYDPYSHPEAAEQRRSTVLSLMVRHGYITKEEAKIAGSIPVSSLLVGKKTVSSEYQGFIDTVVDDVEAKTGLSPYTTSMTIYSTMIKSKQDVINKLYAGQTYHWVNDVVQCGIAVTSAKDGSVVAIGAGRNRTGERTLNFATSIKRQPGSTAKPIFDYGPAIEYAGWGTGTTVHDSRYTYSDGTPINDVDHRYLGTITAKVALAQSRNIPALQAFQATNQEDKYKFVTNLGITPELHNGKILESSSIGAFTGVSPLELSAAYGAFARGGYYIEPYTFTKIVYNDSKETYTYNVKKKKAMSEETAFMINMMLHYAVTSGAIVPGSVEGTDLASKTGTSSIDYQALGLPSSAIGDAWQISYSPDYSIATWYGYEKTSPSQYLSQSEGWTARRLITRALTNEIMEKNSKWTQPEGVVKVPIQLGTDPVALATSYTPSSMTSMEWFKKGTEPTKSSGTTVTLKNVTGLSYSTTGSSVTLSWNAIDDSDVRASKTGASLGTLMYDIYKTNADGTSTKIGETSNTSYTTLLGTDQETITFTVKSTYSGLKSVASSGSSVKVKNSNYVPKQSQNTTPQDNGNTDNNNQTDNNNTGGDTPQPDPSQDPNNTGQNTNTQTQQ